MKVTLVRKLLGVFCGIFIILVFSLGTSLAADRIFYEDCESSAFSEYFLEEQYGSNYAEFWGELIVELTRSTIARSGTYSMTYDPWVDENPHAVVGAGNVPYGNTNNFSLSSINSRYWYFKWYQRWESGQTYSGENKLLYINSDGLGDFTLTVKKRSGTSFHITALRNDGYKIIDNPYPTHSGGSLDDETWHKMEVYVDVGTTGGANGQYWIKIDGIELQNTSGLTFNSTISSNPIDTLMGWPSNVSSATGSQQTWLDDLEIWNGLPSQVNIIAPNQHPAITN